MKAFSIVALALASVLTLAACGKNEKQQSGNDQSTTTAQTAPATPSQQSTAPQTPAPSTTPSVNQTATQPSALATNQSSTTEAPASTANQQVVASQPQAAPQTATDQQQQPAAPQTTTVPLQPAAPQAATAQQPQTATSQAPAATTEQQASAAPAPGGGTVNVYNWADYIGEHTNDNFTKATGIGVHYDVFTSNQTFESRLSTGNTGYDVVVSSDGFLGRQIPAGLFQKLDKSKLPNFGNLDPVLAKATESFDPNHDYSVPYLWGTVGIGYNLDKIKQVMPDAPTDSWAMVLNPSVAAKFKDCGIAVLDTPADVLQSVLIYLGKDPNSENPQDYAEAEKTLQAVRPYIRYFHPDRYIDDMAKGDICLAIGWSGDFAIAQARADSAGGGVHIRYVVPKEGAMLWVDSLAMPKDATHVDAGLKYINAMLDPQTAADNANYVHYATANKAALDKGLISPDDRNNPAIYPPAEVMAKLVGSKPAGPQLEDLRTRTWAAVKAAQ